MENYYLLLSGREAPCEYLFKSSGPLAEALDLLEHPDLAVLKQEMLPFTESYGDVDLDLGMEFPLGNKIDEGFRFTAKAKVKEVRLSGMPLDLEMRNGTVEVDADSENVRVSGTGELSGAEWNLISEKR